MRRWLPLGWEENLEKSLFADVDSLVKPFSNDELAVGKDFRIFDDLNSDYLTLKDWRATARRLEREAASSDDPNVTPLSAALSEWENIAQVSQTVLSEQSKDLEVASWYCEALVRLGGFQSLAGGMELLARLVEDFWDAGLYPQEDEDGVETRLAPLSGLIGRGVSSSLVQAIKLVPLSDRSDQNVALWNLELAGAPPRSDSAEVLEKRAGEFNAYIASIKSASPDFLRATRSGISQTLTNLERLMRAIDAKTQVGSFGSQVSAPLNHIAQMLDDNVGQVFQETTTTNDLNAEDETLNDSPKSNVDLRPQKLSQREDALKALADAADFFEKTEPQALIAASIRDVIRRAKLPLADLFSELLPDEFQRREFMMRAGIKSVD